MKQIEFLTSMLYSQLGITQSILDGTADETTMLNYNNRTIEPIISAIVDEMKRKFLTKTAMTQGQSIEFFRDPFKLVPLSSISNIADAFIRNTILSSNEVRGVIGFKPSDDPTADQLINPNMPQPPMAEDPSMMEDPSMADGTGAELPVEEGPQQTVDGERAVVEDVFNTMTDEQKEVVYAMIGQAVDDAKKSKKQ